MTQLEPGGCNCTCLDQLLTPQQTADLLGVEVDTLAKWRTGRGCEGPAFVKLGRSVRYQRRTLQSFIEANTFNNTVEAYHGARNPV